MSTGLGGETGEVLEILKKSKRKDKKLDLKHLEEELGDVLYYLVMIIAANGLTLEGVIERNVRKNERRKAARKRKVKK